mgnify:CR=1 FL=1
MTAPFKVLAANVSEDQLFETVRELASLYGWRLFSIRLSRRNVRGVRAEGFPDCVLVRAPRLIFAELKSEKGKVSPDQQGWYDDLRECADDGTMVWIGEMPEVYIWRPSDLEKLTEVLR